MIKYAFKIRNQHGVFIDRLHLYGRTEDEAKQKLLQMYPKWDVVSVKVVEPTANRANLKVDTNRRNSFDQANIIDLISNNED